jgi:hypothetical protein
MNLVKNTIGDKHMRTAEQFNTDLSKLTTWLDGVRAAAERNENTAYSIFRGSVGKEPLAIACGWASGFSNDYADLLYVNKTNAYKAMCIKIIINDGTYGYTDFDTLNMPVDRFGNLEDTCVALEKEDDSEAVALFYLTELERLLKDQK